MPKHYCNIFKDHSCRYNLRQSDFSNPWYNYNSVTYGRYCLRYLGGKLLGNLSLDDRSVKTLNELKKHICGKDLTELIEASCKGCILCLISHFNNNIIQ